MTAGDRPHSHARDGTARSALFREADALFDAALDLPTIDRLPFVHRECAANDALRAAVLGLLDGHDRAGPFLEVPAAVIGLPLLAAGTTGPPSRAGPFRVVRQIGSGGMGAVYLGERDDGQFEQRVALKFVRVGEAQLVRRFLAERRILALLEHANIARLVDGGFTADGQPYFAMEYVEGEPITRYCDRHRLTVADRLRLFLHVCAAVEFAHRKRVVHCDLKPANILVTHDGAVKLLDFGVARLLEAEADDASLGAAAQLMTPEYASPELFRGEAATEASDQYALGVLLYELLAGRHPFRAPGTPRTALDPRLLQGTPPPPSALTTRPGLGEALDAIVLTAMSPAQETRYHAVSAFAAQIRQQLDRRATTGPDRRVSTRRRSVAGAAALLLLTVWLLPRSGLQAPPLVAVANVRANDASAAEAGRLGYDPAAAVARSLHLYAPPVGESSRRVVAASALYEAGLAAYYRDADRRSAYRLFVAALAEDSTYAAAAFLAGRAATELFPDSVFRYLQLAESLAVSLPDRERLLIAAHAAAVFSEPRALAVAETLSIRYPRDASAAFLYGAALSGHGDFAAAGVQLRRALLLDPLRSSRAGAACAPCDAMAALIGTHVLADSFPAALQLAREAATLQPGSSAAWQQLVDVLDVMALDDEAADARRHLVGIRPGDAMRDIDEARRQLRRGNFAVADRILGAAAGSVDRSVAAAALWAQVGSYRQQGRLADAARAADRFDQVHQEVGGNSAAPLRSLLHVSVLLDAGQPRRAVRLLDSAFRTLPDHGRASRNARDQAWLLTLKADALAAAGDTGALPALADSIRAIGARSAYGRDPRLHHHVRGLLHVARGEADRAEAEFRAAIYSVIGGYTRTTQELARLLVQQGHAAEAIPLLHATLRAPLDGPALYLTRTEVHAALADAYDVAGQADSAAAHYARVVHAWSNGDPPVRRRLAHANRRLAALRR